MGLRHRSRLIDERCFFVTTTCHHWLKLLENEERMRLLADSLVMVGGKYTTDYLGFVFMPNHIHLLLFFRQENNLSELMRDFKKYTSGEIRRMVEHDRQTNDLKKLLFPYRDQRFKVWTSRFDDQVIHTRNEAEIRLNYIHGNPLQPHWQLAHSPMEYPYSSAAFYETGKECLVPVTDYRDRL